MAYILSLETATKNCSVSISKDGAVVALKEFAGEGYGHAEMLHRFIQECMQESGLTYSQLDAVAVSKGPGSYTGLRIGVSAAKGLCVAAEVPLIALDTLTILASRAKVDSGVIVPMIDARRMEVYTAAFNSKLEAIVPVQAHILTEESFSEVNETIYFLGDSNTKAKTVLTKDNFKFLDELTYPSAREMGALAYEKYQKKQFEDMAYFEPFYLKDFVLG